MPNQAIHHRSLVVIACALFLFLSTRAASQVFTVTDLGSLSPVAINDWAQVAANRNNQAYVWTFGKIRGLSTLPGGTFSEAAGINDAGVVTGTADGAGTVVSPNPYLPNQTCSDLVQPFTWTRRSGIHGLGTIGPNDVSLYPYWCVIPFYGVAANVSGQGSGYTTVMANYYQFGFSWDYSGTLTTFGGSWPPTFVNGINNSGDMVGQNAVLDTWGIGHATVWKGLTATDLGSLGGGQSVVEYGSSAQGVNDQGEIVGWSSTIPYPFPNLTSGWLGIPTIHAVMWTPAGVIGDLGTLPGDTLSAAAKVNYFGVVIGSSGNDAGLGPNSNGLFYDVIGRPFVWTQVSGMRDLNALIPAKSGWVLNAVYDINFWGQIVGQGTFHGVPHGFLLTPKSFPLVVR